MDQNYVSYIDLKHCYDHVDLLNVYRHLEGKLNEKAKDILNIWLIIMMN